MSAEKFIGVLAAIYHRPGGSRGSVELGSHGIALCPPKPRPSGDSTHQTPRGVPCLLLRIYHVKHLDEMDLPTMRNSVIHSLILAVFIVAFFVLASSAIWFVFWFPEKEVATLSQILTQREIIELKNSIRLTGAQIAGGVFVLLGLLLTVLRLRTLEKNVQITQDGQITERFSKAVEQLGNENPTICLGGVYALERIARDSQYDHQTIMEIFTTFVRDKAPWKANEWNAEMSAVEEFIALVYERENIHPDEYSKVSSLFQPRYPDEEKPPPKVSITIQTVMTVVGRRSQKHEKGRDYRLNLRRTDFPKIELRKANLCHANFTEAHIDYADFTEADLRWTLFEKAHLVRAKLNYSKLRYTNLNSAHLELADLEGADLSEAILTFAYLLGTDLRKANLQGANLSYAYLGETSLSDDDIPDDPEYVFKGFSTTNLAGADLRNANLCHTDLFLCNLEGADLRGADLTNACIKQEQLKLVLINKMTKLPKSFWSDPYKKS